MLERSVRFSYEDRVTWLVLVGHYVDPEIAKIIGRDIPEFPPILWSTAQFNRLLSQWYLVLSAHKLDGGYGHFWESDDRLHAEIVVVPRRMRLRM